MNETPKVLHINPVGENWEVESEAGTLGQTETQPEAIELARTLAKEQGVTTITVHTSDGQVEQELHVAPATPEQA